MNLITICLGDMEQWKAITGYEGLYEVSNEGRIKSVDRYVVWMGTLRHCREKILKGSSDKDGYLILNLHKEGKKKMFKIHRLVAEAFIDNPDDKPQINHLDECKTNNSVDNIEWCDAKRNVNYGSRNEKVSQTMKGYFINRPDQSIPVDMLTKQGELIRTFPSMHEAVRWLRSNGFPTANHGNINRCCRDTEHNYTAYGFKWSFTKGN